MVVVNRAPRSPIPRGWYEASVSRGGDVRCVGRETHDTPTIASAAPSTRVVVLNACYSAQVADSLRHEVDCVVGIDHAIADTAARSFAVAFYRALGHRRSIGNAVDQAAATLEAKHPGARPMCATRNGLRADQIFLPAVGSGASSGGPVGADPR